ncbi:MAG: tripartite tricarboxylate transporter permease [Sphaerochaetaceae bacterium]
MNAILVGFQVLFSNPMNLVLLTFGIFMGIFFGAIPGLTATLGVCLMIPFTFNLSAVEGVTLLVSIYVGGISGGLITATLINIPGTPSSIFTCLDGYPMAKQGKPDVALAIGVFASLIGGTFSAAVLFGIAPQLAKVALFFGNWEYFSVALMGIAIVVAMSGRELIKGLMGAIIGLLLGAVGMDAVTGVSRLTFGNWQLQGGISMTALMMGLFAIREIFDQTSEMHQEKMRIKLGKVSFLPPFKEMKDCWKSIGIGCLIGTGIGILPGIGQNAATILSYNQAKNVSKHPELFGHGNPEGICASESSNNAVNGGALIPLLTLGIPGDMTTAMLIGGLMIHGLQPGPLLFSSNVEVVGAVMVAYFIANFVMYFMELGLMKVFVKMINVKLSLLFPAIIVCCVLGVLALNNRIFDVWILIIFGIVGYILKQLDIDLTPVILGFILGPIVEKYFRMGMISGNGHFSDIFTRPVAVIFLIISVMFIAIPYMKKLVLKTNGKKTA